MIHCVRRSCVYEDLIELYTKKKEAVLNEYPFRTSFDTEAAIDTGGVSRDLFSAFFNEMYVNMFDGASLLYPAVHAAIDINSFGVFGTILSHAYLATGILPDRIAFPCLASILLGSDTLIPDAVLTQSFISSLCCHDQAVLQQALKQKNGEYPSDTQEDLVSMLSSQGCREIPKPGSLNRLLGQAARYTFLVRPAAALNVLSAGVPQQHRSFWSGMSLDSLLAIYNALSVTTSKVLRLLEEPVITSASQEVVWLYLRRFIGNLRSAELRAFLRFVTGSFVICVSRITVTFNKLDGLARRPISHTCSATLELSSTYTSLPQFVAEFRSVLADPSYSWRMDSI